jgi:hypothetical protein
MSGRTILALFDLDGVAAQLDGSQLPIWHGCSPRWLASTVEIRRRRRWLEWNRKPVPPARAVTCRQIR